MQFDSRVCPNCQARVCAEASTCPNCNYDFNSVNGTEMKKGSIVFVRQRVYRGRWPETIEYIAKVVEIGTFAIYVQRLTANFEPDSRSTHSQRIQQSNIVEVIAP